MRFFADENFLGDAVTLLRKRSHDVLWAVEVAAGEDDKKILARAQTETRIVLTFDKDFGELAFKNREPASHGIILFRLSGSPPDETLRIILSSVESQVDWSGMFCVVTSKRIRIVPLPS
jgi:predicted nuclease of predicted toxin-antitoxin system